MRISINLASRPFVELGPLFARLRLVMAAFALTAVALAAGLHQMNAHASAEQAQMDALTAQTRTTQLERQTNEARMKEPQNRAVLDRSQFLNAVFARKSFSWTSVMMDLERVLPAGVQVTSIEPAITPNGDLNIRLRVSGQRDLAVDLVHNLELSQRFVNPRLVNETAQSQDRGNVVPVAATGPPGVEFDIVSGYNPLPASLSNKSQEQKDGEQKDATQTNVSQTNKVQPAQSKLNGPVKSPVMSSNRRPANPQVVANRSPVANPKVAAGSKATANRAAAPNRKAPPASTAANGGKPATNGGTK